MEIYKINHICINQIKTQFCLSYNKGVKIYDLKNLAEISCSNYNNQTLVNLFLYLGRYSLFFNFL